MVIGAAKLLFLIFFLLMYVYGCCRHYRGPSTVLTLTMSTETCDDLDLPLIQFWKNYKQLKPIFVPNVD